MVLILENNRTPFLFSPFSLRERELRTSAVHEFCALPGVLSRHDMECMTSEQMESVPIIMNSLHDSDQKHTTECKCNTRVDNGSHRRCLASNGTLRLLVILPID